MCIRDRYTHWAVVGIMLLGWGTTLVWELPFSLSQGAVIVPYLYIGYLAAIKTQNGAAMSVGRISTFLDLSLIHICPAAPTRQSQ